MNRSLLMMILILFTLISCRDTTDQLFLEEIKRADSIELRVITDHDRPDADKIHLLKGQDNIRILAAAINGSSIDPVSCDPEGKMYFFRNGTVFRTVYYSTRSNCRYFSFIADGKAYYTRMREDVVIYIRKLAAKHVSRK